MHSTFPRRTAGLILSCAAILAASASPAGAATASITGDDGNPVPIQNGMTLRHMAPDINFTLASGEYYAARVVGPGGAAASTGTSCSSFAAAERVRYQGNGTYTLFTKSGADRAACDAATEQSFQFTINASTALAQPERQPLLMREPKSFAFIPFDVPVNGNPGADTYELRYALNATLGPDGGITGETLLASVDTSTGTARVSFTRPGRYTLVVRAKSFRSDVPTAWSPRVDVSVVAPFDLSTLSFPDQRGPSYSLLARLREKSASGRVTVSIGKGHKAKRFKRLGVVKMRKGKIKLRFRLTKFGKYTLRFSHKGGPTTAGGTFKEPIIIRRTFF